ncbi:hypothetical protein Ancab_020181, partial [Ancistrocladus abbreviatus]
KRGKKRGNYNCGRCGLPKKGHVCNVAETSCTPTPSASSFAVSFAADHPTLYSTPAINRQSYYPRLPRALSFDDIDIGDHQLESKLEGEGEAEEPDYFGPEDLPIGVLPGKCLWEVLRRLPPRALFSVAGVCKGWRECTKRLWKAAEELRLTFPVKSPVGFIGSVLQKCTGLVRLSLRMERLGYVKGSAGVSFVETLSSDLGDVDATVLACIAFSCPNLESMELSKSDASINWITGDELGRFVADKQSLSTLKMEGCSNLWAVALSSNSLSTLWLSDLHSLSNVVFNCPNLKEISLEFSGQENDNTDLAAMLDNLGRYCLRLQKIHIASTGLSHAAVLALTAANLRALRMLSLIMGSGITDASVAAITSGYPKLELLDLSGSSISDSGIQMICNVFPQTLSKLLLALCPSITSNGIQFATTQLPFLELMDCGMTLFGSESDGSSMDKSNHSELHRPSKSNLHIMYQKLIIKHSRLKKLSLWGCSSLDALDLNCPQLIDLNLNSCRNLNPERLLLHCPNLESVHASGCLNSLVGIIESQVNDSNAPTEKRMADGSKRVRVPHLFNMQSSDDIKGQKGFPQQVDEYELVDPVDILTPLEKSGFWDGVKAAKWSERKEAVAELTKLASTKRIAPGDFTEVCRMLKKLITDVNIAAAVEAIQAIGNLAMGLRTHFSGNSCFLLPVLLLYNELYRPHLLFPMLGAVLDQ